MISGPIKAHKVLLDDDEIDDNVSCQLPSLETQTSEIKGAGILGSIDMPSVGTLGNLTFSINLRSVNKNSHMLLKPGVVKIEVRGAIEVDGDKGIEIKKFKAFLTAQNKKYDPGKIENGNTMDGSAEWTVTRYSLIVDGVEVLLIDKKNMVYKVNGIDYLAELRAALN